METTLKKWEFPLEFERKVVIADHSFEVGSFHEVAK
jgi:hypothetical protein